MAPRRQSSPIEGSRNIHLPDPNIEPDQNIHHDCLCDFYFTNEIEKPMRGDIKLCKTHRICCQSCQPTCHAPPPPTQAPSTPNPTISILDLLHPTPRNRPTSPEDDSEKTKTRQQKHEQRTWAVHLGLLKNLASNPYEDCICDIVGLDSAFQIVQDPSSGIDYAHRPDCLIYPNIPGWDADPQHVVLHAAQAANIQHFRKTGRSKSGRKQYAKKALWELVGMCRLRHQQVEDDDARERADGKENNAPMQYNPRTIAADILRVAGIHPFRPPLNPHLKPQTTSPEETPTTKPKRKRQRASMPNPKKRFKSAEFILLDSDHE
ncbi:MAG: hypothetical protein Q9195_009609 [Heterodermia aff. obscurata]